MPKRFENGVAAIPLAAMVALAASELVIRRAGSGLLSGALPLLQHLTLWIGFLGAAVAARERRLLALATETFLPEGRWRLVARTAAATVGAAVASLLARACYELVRVERASGDIVAFGIPVWVAQLVLPFAFAAIAIRLVASVPGRWGRAVAGVGLLVGIVLGHWPQLVAGWSAGWGIALILLATIAGAPLFATLGGIAIWCFLVQGSPIAAVPVESYRLAVSPTLPSVPLFTLAGFFLAEGKSALRLLELFRAVVGWLPGGTAVVVAILCAFFTTFTGGSGVTILALGILLYRALVAEGYPERFSLGLVTSSGALGLLFPPAVPMIFYGVVAQVPIPDLFRGGVAPGLLLVAAVAIYGMTVGARLKLPQTRFSARGLARSLWNAKWELSVPVVVAGALFSGVATVVESAAIAALWTGVIQIAIHRDVGLRDVPRILLQCTIVVGGVLLILAAAMGLTSYLVDAEVPAFITGWAHAHIASRAVFLLGLNALLLVVGCLMDIFSATAVVVPLIVPLGVAFGVDPIHLGVIFVANMELGFLTPTVGVNIFLASYRFEKPVLTISRAVLPFLAIQAIGVLVITYVPWLTRVFLN